MQKQFLNQWVKALKLVETQKQFSGVSSVDCEGVEMWANELTDKDKEEIEREINKPKWRLKSRIADGSDILELYLEKGK